MSISNCKNNNFTQKINLIKVISKENRLNIQELETIVGKNNINLWENIDPTKQQQISQAIAPNNIINCII